MGVIKLKKNKVGILTYTNTTNYGAILQCIALKNIVSRMNYDCDVINYTCKAVAKRERILFNGSSKSLRQIIKTIILLPIKIIRKIKIYNFIKNNYVTTNEKYNRDNISQINTIYNHIIVGSDQIWNPVLNGYDKSYILDFAADKINKIAYAASVGNNKIIPDNYDYFKNIISRFDHISLREKTTSDYINKTFKTNSDFVLDPTMLLSKEEWKQIIDNSNNNIKNNKKYILLYFIHNGEKTFSIARKIADKLGYEILYLNNYGVPVKGVKNIFSITPYEFVNYIYNAELVITGSFHGVAFSLDLNKQFMIEISSSSSNANDRLLNLMTIFKLDNDIYKMNFDKIFDDDKTLLNYKFINQVLDKERKKSLDLLRRWLEGE